MPKEKKPKETTSSRRGFIWNLWMLLGGVFLLETVWVVVDFLRPRLSRAEPESGTIVVAGPIERFEPESVTAFPQGKFYLARLEDGGFLALSRECTHLGCTVPWIDEERRFLCPCHASAFDVTGDVVSPPAPRALDLYAVRIENGIVKVDISRPLRRQSFQVAQVTRP
jgi:cytochrome b6-f complex iron-sulfur subunit